ncbi:MAG: ATP-dependent RecD-like DNA helicase [Candidatus Auribacterota bacterium]
MMDPNPAGTSAQQHNAVAVKGVVNRIVYRNEENSYIVARFVEEGKSEPITIVGFVTEPTEGQHAVITGRWEYNAKFGQQFRIQDYRQCLPSSREGIERFLGSGLIHGIGPEMAHRIVERFGEESLKVIDETPHRLKFVPGIGEKRIAMICEGWKQHREVRHILITLNDLGLSPSLAQRIYAKYKSEAVQVIETNPYRLAYELRGIGFHKADAIALNAGKSPESPHRIEAAIYYYLNQASEDGHLYLPRTVLVERLATELKLSADLIEPVISELAVHATIIIDDREDDLPVYLKDLYDYEQDTAARVAHLMKSEVRYHVKVSDQLLSSLAQRLKIELDPDIAELVKTCINRRLMIITGGPGTGKTTLVRLILALLHHAGQNVQLAAPTGRAAKRMHEATGDDAVTLHRLLEYMPAKNSFQRNSLFPIDAMNLIVDEVSMVDMPMMASLLPALKEGGRLILVGDADQLPSVGPGSVLQHLLDLDTLPRIQLTRIYRQAQNSDIVMNAHRINHGQPPVVANEENTDFFFIEKDTPDDILSIIQKLVAERIPAKFGYDPLRDIQVIAPMRKGVAGVENLNVVVQELLNKSTATLKCGNMTFKLGDKVMQIVNNYDLDVYNGDIGIVSFIDADAGQLSVDYYGRAVVYEQAGLHEITLAYAISVHKSQGSEYKVVVMPLSDEHYIMMQRNLLYTAVTRAKKLVVLVGSKKSLFRSLSNNRISQRYSLLSRRCRRFMSL